MTTYSWKITNLFTKTVDGLQDYVVTAMFEVEGVDGEFSSTISGNQMFTVKEGSEFIPYANLTKQIVVDWIKEELGENGVISITAWLNNSLVPTVVQVTVGRHQALARLQLVRPP